MYDLNLTESYVPAQLDGTLLDLTVGGLLRERAAALPDAVAVTAVAADGALGQSWTHAELLADAERLALSLMTRFEPGERVVVWAPNVGRWLLMEYACALAGLVLVTANPSFQAGELRYVVEQSGSVALFHVASHRGNPMAAIAREASEGLGRVREVVDLDHDNQLYATGGRPAALPMVAPGDAAQIQYTSGTTGFPKGAVLSHHSLVNNARLFAERALVDHDSVYANFMPLFHTAGCATGAFGSLQAGCRMLLIEQFDADALAMRIETERVTNFFAVPTILVALLESLEQQPRNVESLVAITTGGAPVSPELVERVRTELGCHLLTAFGQTEASPMITLNHTDVSADHIASSAGQPLPLTEVSIRTARDDGAAGVATSVVPVGEVGEICARGYGVMIGYNDNPDATAAAIDDEGWLHTGDLGTLDEQGFVRITGRVKDMIIRGGENHFPAEIENALLEHPAVAEVAVVGLPDAKWGEVIGAFVRTVGDEPIDIDELRARCREGLSPQKTPSVWEQLKEFPLTGSGKIQKFAIRDDYLNRSATEGTAIEGDGR